MRLHLLAAVGFLSVLAPEASAQQRVEDFFNPTIKDFRLDFCRHWGTQCGQPAADLFCQEKGYQRASAWSPSGPAGTTTLVFGDGALCESPGCLGFAHIQCATGAPAPPQIAVPQPPPVNQFTPDVPAQIMVPRPPPQPEAPAVAVPIPAAPVVPAAPPVVAAPPPPAETLPIRPLTPATPPAVARPAPPALATPIPPRRPQPGAPVAVAAPPGLVAGQIDRVFVVPDYSVAAVTSRWLHTITVMEFLPEGAALFRCSGGDCSVSHAADEEMSGDAADQNRNFNWSVSKVPHAGGVAWQVSYFPFPEFSGGGQDDLSPRGLVASGHQDGTGGFFNVDFRAAAARLPAGAEGAVFHVRVLPVVGASGRVVGQPSNVMKVYYDAPAPAAPPFRFYSPDIVEEAPPVRLTALDFTAHDTIDWPNGCVSWEEYRRSLQKNAWERIRDGFKSMWNFASEAYQWAKDKVVEFASILTFGAIPEEVLEFALNATLASVGIPPNIPNLDAMLSGSLDHLASEIASAAVSQIPAADLAPSLGNLGADIVVNLALAEGEAQAREALQEELEKTSRQALQQTIDSMDAAVSSGGGKVPCQRRFIPASYRFVVQNTGPEALKDVDVTIGDTLAIYESRTTSVDLDPGQTLSVVVVPDPKLRDIWNPRLVRFEPDATNDNYSHWWTEFLNKQATAVTVTLPGHTECLGTCRRTVREEHRAPPQLLDRDYAWRLSG